MEAGNGPDISEYGSAYGIGHLLYELIGHHQIELILSRLGQDCSKRIGCEVLELIYIQIEIFTFILFYIGPSHRLDLKFCYHHGPEQGA